MTRGIAVTLSTKGFLVLEKTQFLWAETLAVWWLNFTGTRGRLKSCMRLDEFVTDDTR